MLSYIFWSVRLLYTDGTLDHSLVVDGRIERGGFSMADVRPFAGIRYAPDLTSQLAALVTPPYDVISPEAQAAYYERHPNNIIRLELGREQADDDTLNNRYTRAAATFSEWRMQGVLRQRCCDSDVLGQRLPFLHWR